MHALLLLLGSYIGNTAAIVANSYVGKTPILPMAKGKPARRLSMVPKFSVVNAIEEIIVIIIIIIIIRAISHPLLVNHCSLLKNIFLKNSSQTIVLKIFSGKKP